MSFKKFKKLFLTITDMSGPDDLLRVVNQLQGNIETSVSSMVVKVQNDSEILTNVRLTAGQNNIINHTLRRPLIKWSIIRIRSQARIWDDQDNNPSPELSVWLHTDTNVTVDIEVA